jgi:thioredoxin reductase
MLDLIVVGGGPAGLTASVYAIRQRLDVLLVSEDLGGKVAARCEFAGLPQETVIRGRELVQKFKDELGYLQLAHRLERVVSIAALPAAAGRGTFTVVTQGGQELQGRAVIVATGCRFSPPAVPGAAEYLLRGIGYSSASYSHLFLERTVALIGSGGRAVRSALRMAYSARRVYLLPDPEGPLEPALSSPEGRLLAGLANVTVLPDHRVQEFRGDRFARELVVVAPGGEQSSIRAEGFFLEAEATPNSEVVQGLVEREAQGFIRVDSRNRTSRPGVFAAGDVTDVHREQVLVAVGEGAKASLSAQELLFAGRR